MPRVKLLVAERMAALTPLEQLAVLRHGWYKAPWEDVPDFAARILKRDPRITLASGAKVAAIFRAAYDALTSDSRALCGDEPGGAASRPHRTAGERTAPSERPRRGGNR